MVIDDLLDAAQIPDISFAVGAEAKFNSNLERENWTAVKQVIRYLWGTKYARTADIRTVGHVYTNYADDRDDSRSINDYIFSTLSWLMQL